MNAVQIDSSHRTVETNLYGIFEDIACKFADHAALYISDTKKTYSYNELKRAAEHCALWLHHKNIQHGEVVAMFNNKSFNAFAMMLACLKLGIVYTNIDPDSPQERLNHILETCKPKLIVSDYNKDELCVVIDKPFYLMSEVSSSIIPSGVIYLDCTPDYNSTAYIMFTSGSTGKPKGVTIQHKSVINFIAWIRQRYRPCHQDIISNINPIYFDNSVFDFYASLFCGATLAPIKTAVITQPKQLKLQLERAKCTIFFAVPSVFVYLQTLKLFNSDAFNAIRIFTFGGEAYPKSQLKRLFDKFNNQARFINVYGPTEGTCICSSYEVSGKDFDDLNTILPLGKINSDFDFLILDEDCKPVNQGCEGELCLFGENISSGYYQMPELTNRAFVQYEKDGIRQTMYRTGDLVRQDQFGCFYFCGRKDFQIKHMGYRVEIEEIEHVLNACEGVLQVAIIYNKSANSGGNIIAYLKISEQLKHSELEDYASRTLPLYMQPSKYIFVDELAKNANGKIDRSKLDKLHEETCFD